MRKLVSVEENSESSLFFLFPIHSVNFVSVDYILKPILVFWQLVLMSSRPRLQGLDKCFPSDLLIPPSHIKILLTAI